MTSVLRIFAVTMLYFRKVLELWLKNAVCQFSYYKTSVRKNLGPLKPSRIIEGKQMALADIEIIQTYYLTVTCGTLRSLTVAL